jgi:hypothetical protein
MQVSNEERPPDIKARAYKYVREDDGEPLAGAMSAIDANNNLLTTEPYFDSEGNLRFRIYIRPEESSDQE